MDHNVLSETSALPINCLEIEPVIYYTNPSEKIQSHIYRLEKTLLSVIPSNLLYTSQEEIEEWVEKSTPFFKWSECKRAPECLTLYLLCKPLKEIKTQNFFIDLLNRWLIDNKEIDIISSWNMSFHFPRKCNSVYFLAEVNVLIENTQDLLQIQKNLPLIAKEIIMGLKSWNYARYILENKYILYDRKVSLTSQDLIRLLEKRPNYFDSSIFLEIHRFLALTNRDFREHRPYRHLTRLACSLYLVRKTLRDLLTSFPEKRHLYIRFVPTNLQFTFGSKPVLGIVVGVNLFDQNEFFNEKHILSGIRKYIPQAQSVKNTFYSYQEPKDNIRTLYFEIEKKDGEKFLIDEIKTLKKNLTVELKNHIEKLIPALFLTRNEEETMRNILILSQELKYVSDFPQVIISFDYQSIDHLIFTIVMVRVGKDHAEPVDVLLKKHHSELQFTIERMQTIGYLRKKHPKEACVFRLKLPKKESFLRQDSSVNLLQARNAVLDILESSFGTIRDFNGGMLFKQSESFSILKRQFPKLSVSEQDLLETFFYSINPIDAQARLQTSILENFSKLFFSVYSTELIKKNVLHCKTIQGKKHLFMVVKTFCPSIHPFILNKLKQEKLISISAQVKKQRVDIFGYIFPLKKPHDKEAYLKIIRSAKKHVKKQLQQAKISRINQPAPPINLDPRMGGDEDSKTILSKLFEGLVKVNHHGKIENGVAKSYQIKNKGLTYIFKLRDCHWSDGSKVCAYDFEYSWKKTLSPSSASPFLFLFYPIKNVFSALKDPKQSHTVGIKALDEYQLQVDLEYPAPYFLEFLSLPLFYPISHKADQNHPNWMTQDKSDYICNGPYTLLKNRKEGTHLEKNPLYWDTKKITSDQIHISYYPFEKALQMFDEHQMDTITVPARLLKNRKSSHPNHVIKNSKQYVEILFFNTDKFPFHNEKIRKALSLCINKKQLLKKIGEDAQATDKMIFFENKSVTLNDQKKAQKLFFEGLFELNMSSENFPIITLKYRKSEKRDKVAHYLQESWKNILGIESRQEAYEERKIFYEMLTKGNYEMGLLQWTSSGYDPVYTLNNFRYKEHSFNLSNWEQKEFQDLLYQADCQENPQKRKLILTKAENYLLGKRPILPLYFESDNLLQKLF